ncbi:transcription factor dp1 [Stylonychia lemnae]|uniref:Transcription factor dp1 n=1 Tax=Stylonychia lemnae TaxID=5949 RepID=A0A078AZN2_STYLE|nr:transcription factor dp1 [Stylonychia lemnae]|eukprot:CDW87654.1 transcription factor dp1 [Stylonychia lemnae]
MHSYSPIREKGIIGKRNYNTRDFESKESHTRNLHPNEDFTIDQVQPQASILQNYNQEEEIVESISDSNQSESDEDMKQQQEMSDGEESAIQQPNKYYKYARKKRSSENKKLVFLSKKVLEEVSTKKETTGTNSLDFKNVQRRVYDALNVLSALDVITKDRNRITFKGYNGLLQQTQESRVNQDQQIIQSDQLTKEIDDVKMRLEAKTAFMLEIAQQVRYHAFRLSLVNGFEKTSGAKLFNAAIEQFIFEDQNRCSFQKDSQIDILQKEDQEQMIVNTDKQFEIVNENHVMQKINLNTMTNDDIKNLLQPQLQQYLRDKFSIEDEQMIETQLFCDEAPLSQADLQQLSQNNIQQQREYNSQQYHENVFSQNSGFNESQAVRKQSDFGNNNNNGGGNFISNPNSIMNTPLKFKFNSFGNKANMYNLSSPYKPIKTEMLDIHNSFMDKNDHYHYMNSPLIGNGTMIMANDIFNEMESTNYYSNFTNNTCWQKEQQLKLSQSGQQNQSSGNANSSIANTKSPINIQQFVANNSQQSINNDNRDTPYNKTPFFVGKISPLGVPSLSNILHE